MYFRIHFYGNKCILCTLLIESSTTPLTDYKTKTMKTLRLLLSLLAIHFSTSNDISPYIVVETVNVLEKTVKAGTASCSNSGAIIAMHRTDCNNLGCIDTFTCARPKWSFGVRNCVAVNVNSKQWTDCPAGMYLNGFTKSACDTLDCVTTIRCCFFSSSGVYESVDRTNNDWLICFDREGSCDIPENQFISGLYRHENGCSTISCIEKSRSSYVRVLETPAKYGEVTTTPLEIYPVREAGTIRCENGILVSLNRADDWCKTFDCLTELKCALPEGATGLRSCKSVERTSLGWSYCPKDYFLSGIGHSNCNKLSCINSLECCRLQTSNTIVVGTAINTPSMYGCLDSPGWCPISDSYFSTGIFLNENEHCDSIWCIEDFLAAPVRFIDSFASPADHSQITFENKTNEVSKAGVITCKDSLLLSLRRDGCNDLPCLREWKCGLPVGATGLGECQLIEVQDAFSLCPTGLFMNGFERGDCDELLCLTKIRCCNIVSTWGSFEFSETKDLDFGHCFDRTNWCEVWDQQFITGIFRHGNGCNGLHCIEQYKVGKVRFIRDTELLTACTTPIDMKDFANVPQDCYQSFMSGFSLSECQEDGAAAKSYQFTTKCGPLVGQQCCNTYHTLCDNSINLSQHKAICPMGQALTSWKFSSCAGNKFRIQYQCCETGFEKEGKKVKPARRMRESPSGCSSYGTATPVPSHVFAAVRSLGEVRCADKEVLAGIDFQDCGDLDTPSRGLRLLIQCEWNDNQIQLPPTVWPDGSTVFTFQGSDGICDVASDRTTTAYSTSSTTSGMSFNPLEEWGIKYTHTSRDVSPIFTNKGTFIVTFRIVRPPVDYNYIIEWSPSNAILVYKNTAVSVGIGTNKRKMVNVDIAYGEWHQIAVVVEDGVGEIYVDHEPDPVEFEVSDDIQLVQSLGIAKKVSGIISGVMLLPKVIDPREYLPDLDNLNRASSMLLARYVFYDSLLDQSGHQFHLSLLSEEAKPQFEGFELNGGTTPSFKADVSSGSTAGLDGLLLGELSICTFVKINKIADGNTILIKFTSENDEEITLMFGIYQNPETGSRSWVLFLIGLEENFLFSVAALPKTEYYVCLVLESKSDKSYHGLLVVDGSTVFDNIIKGTNTTATGAHKSVLSKNLYIGQLVDGVIYEMSVFGRTLESEFISTLMRTSQTKLQLRGQNKADVDIITNPPTPAPPELVNGLLFYIPLRGGLGKTGSIIGVEPSFVTNGQSLPEGYLIQDHATDFLTYETLRIMKAVSFSIAFSVNTTTGTLLTVTDLHSIFLDSGKLKVTYNKQTSTISDVTIQTEKWTHILVTVTADGTQVIVYVDGVFKAQFPAGSATAQTQVVTISSEEEGILGTFCEFRGYNAPISSSEVKKIYSQLRNHPLMYCIKSVCAEVDTDSENIVQTMKTVTLSDSENIIITSPLVAVYKLTSAVEGDACRESFLINVENGTHTRVPFGRYTICGETVYGDSISMGIIVVISQVLSIGGYAPGEIPVLPEHQIMLPVIPDVRNLDSLEVLVCGSDSSVSLISSPVLLVTEITERVSICFGDGSKTGWDLVPAPIRLDDSDEAPFKTESRRFSDGIIRLPAIVYHNVTVEVHDLPKSVSNDPAQARVKVTPKAGDCDSNGASHMAGTLRKKDDSDDILMTFGVATFEAIQSGNLRVNRLCLSLSQTAPWQELNITLSILDPSINEIQLEDGLFTVEGQTAIHLIGSGMELFTENSGLNGRIGAEQLHGSWLVGGPLQAKGNEAISTLIFPRIIENTKDDNLPDIPIFGSGVDSNDTAGEDRPSKPQKENEKRNLGDRMMGSFRQEKPSFELTDSLDIELELFIFGNWVRYGIEEGVQIRHIRIDGLNVLKRGSDVLEPFSLNISNRTDSWIYSSPGNVEPVPLGFMALGLDMIASVIGSSLNYGPGIDITFAEHCSEITSNSTDASITFPTPPAGPGGPGNGIPRNKTFPEITFPGSFLSPPKIGIHSMCLRSGSGYPGTWYPAGFKIHVIPKITSLGYDGEIVFQDTFITTGNLEMIAGSEPEIEIGHLTPEDYEEDGILWLSFGINDCLIQPHRLSDSDPDAYAFPVQPITSNSSGEKTLVLSLNGAETVNLGNLVSETSPEPLYICVGYGTDQNMAPYQNNFFTKLKTRLIITGFRIGDLNAPLHPYSGKQDTSDFVENTKLPVYELYDASGFLEMKTELQHVMIIAINVDKKCGSLPLSSGQELLAGGKFNLAAPGYEFLTGDEYRLCAMIPSQKVNGIRITAPFTSFEDTGFRFVGISLSSFGDIQSNFADGYDTQIAVMQNEGVTLPFIFEPPGVIASSQLSDEVTSQVLIKFVDTTSCNDEGYEIPLGKTRSIIFPETLQTSGKVYKLCLKVRLRGLYPGTTIWIRPPFQVKILPFSTINGRSQKQAGRPLTFFHGLVGNFLFDCKQRQDGCLHKDVSNMVLEVTNGCFSKNKTIFSRADVLYSHERKYHFKTHRPMKTTMSTGPLEICINAAALTLKVEVLSISISGLNIGIDSTNTSTLTVRKSKGIEDERATTLSVATQGQTLSPIWVSISRLHRCGTNIGAIVDGVSTAPIPVQACSGFLTINKEAYAPRETNTKLSLCVAAANEGNDAPETMFFMNTILNYMVTDHESFQVEQQPGQVSFADGILTVNPTLRIVSADSHQPMTTLSQDVTIKLHYEYCNVDDYDYEQCMMFCHLTGQFNYSSANITCNEHCEDISQHSCYVNESISWMLEEDHTIPQKTVRPEEYSSNGAIIKFDKLVLRGKHRVWYRIVFQSVLEGEMRAATEPFRMGPCYHWNVGSWVLDSGINRTRFRFNSSVEKSQLEWKSGTSSYAIPGSTLCHVCPEGGICDGSTDIRTDGNYFRPSFLSTTFYNCLESQACEQNKSIGTCKDGYKTHDITEAEYHNPICMLCAEGYGKVPGSSTLCRECLPDEWTWTYAVVTGIIAFLAIMFLVRQSIVSGNQGDRGGSDFMIYFKLLTTHCATASLLGDYGNKMASMVQGFLDYEKTASGGTVGDLSTIDCVLPNNYYDKFTFFMLIPCFIPVVLSVVFFLLLLIRICTSDKPKYQELTKEASIALFSELYVLYENDNPAGKKPGDKPPDEKPNDKPGDKPQNEKPNDKPDNKPQNEKPNDKPGDKPPDEKPNDKPGDKPQNEKPNDKLSDKKPNEKKNTKGKKTKVYLPIPAEFILKNKEHMMKFVNSKTNLELTVTSFANMSNCGTYDAHRLNDTLQIIVRAAAKHETIMNIHDADLIFGHLVCRALKAKIDGKIPEEDDEIIHLKHNSRVYAEHGNWNSIPMTKVEEFFPIFEMRHKQFSNVLGYLNFEQLREHYFTVDKTCNPERLNNTMVTDVWFKEMLMATITETNISAYDHFIKKMRHFKIITGEEHNTVLTSEHIRSGFDMYMLRNPHQDFSVRMPWFKFWEGLDRQNGEAKHISKADFMATVTDSRAGVYLRKKHQEYVDIQKKEDWLGHYLGFKTDKLHHPFLAAIVVASVIAYPHLVRTAALFMQCDGYDYGGVGLAHGSERQFFRHDLSLDCNSDRFKYYQNVAKGLLALYGAGIPLAAMYGMYLMTNAEKTEKRLRSEKFACLGDLSDNEDDAADIKEDAKLAKRKLMSLLGANDGTRRMRGNQDDIMHDEKRQETMMGARRQLTKKLKNAEDRIAVFRMAFGFLAAGYRDEFAGWECVIMIRKLIMVVISVFLDGHASTALATWTMLVFCLIHRNVKPYKKSNVNQLESTSLIVITMTLQLSLLYDDDVAAFSEDMSENPWRRAGFWIVSIFLFVINVGVILLIIINWFHSSPGFFRDTVAGKYGLLNKFYASCISIMPKFLEFTQGRVLLRKNLLTNERWVNTIDDRKTAGELQLYEKNRLTLIGLKEKKKKKKVLKEEKQKQLEELEKNYDKENIDLLETRMPLMHVQEQEFLGVYWSRFLTNSIVLNRFDFSREIKHTVVGTDFKPRTVPSTQSLPAPVREPKPWFCVGSRVKLDPKVPAKYLKLYGKFDVPPMLEFEYKKQTYEMKLVHGNHNLRPFWKSTGDECVLLFFCNPKWYLVSYSKNVDKPEFEDEFTIICHSFMEDRHRKVADDYVFKEPGMDLKESVAEAAQHKKIIENARYDADEEEEEDDADLRNEEEEDELAINRMTVNYLPHIAKWPDGMAVRINCRGVIVSTMSFVVQEIQRYTAEVHFFTNRIQWYPESYEEEPNILVSLPLKDLVPDVDRVASSSNSYHQSGSWKILSDTDEMVVQPEKKIESIRAFARLRKTCCDGFAWESLEKKDANAENNDNFKTFGDASALHSCEKCEVCFCKGDQRIRCVIRGSNWEITELCTFYFKGGPPTWFLGYEAICDLPTCKWVGDPKILFGMNEQFCCSTDFINRSCILREEDAKSKNNITIGFEYWVPSDVGYAPICIQSLSVTEGPIAEQRSSPGFQAIISFVDVFEEEEDIIELRSMWDLERPMIEVSEKDKGNEVLLIENAREQLAKMVAANEAAKAQSAKKSMVMDPGSMPQHLSPVSEVTSVEKFTEDAESK